MIEWLVAGAVLLLFLFLFLFLFLLQLPRMVRRTKAVPRKSGGSGVILAIGIAFSMIFDAKASQAIELIEQKKDIGDSETGESGDKPEGSLGHR